MPLPFLIPIILGGLAAAGITTAIILAILNWSRIVDWFKGRKSLKQQDKDNIAFTIKQEMANGNFEVVQGIFNEETEELLDGEKYEAEELDAELAKHHRNGPLVVYN